MELLDYLKQAVGEGASDLFIVAGGAVSDKLDGHIRPLSEKRVFPAETEALITEIYRLANRDMDRYRESGDDDFSFSVPGLARFRVNTYRQRGSMAAVVRVVSFEIPDYRTLGIPESVMELADVAHGMVLVTGTAGSGNPPRRPASSTASTRRGRPISSRWRTPSNFCTGISGASSASGRSPSIPRTISRLCGPACVSRRT